MGYAGKIKCFRTLGNYRSMKLIEAQKIITGKEIEDIQGKLAVYATVSSHEQKKKGELRRQIETIQDYCIGQDIKTPETFQDIGI